MKHHVSETGHLLGHSYGRRLSRTKMQYFPVKIFCAILLSLLLFPTNFPVVVQAATAFAAIKPPSSQATMTLKRFLAQGQRVNAYHGPVITPSPATSAPSTKNNHLANYSHLPASAEPAKMQPLTQALTNNLLTTSASGQGTILHGSDKRLEVQIPANTFDLSQAHVTSAKGAAVVISGVLTLHMTQLSGHSTGEMNELGSYQLQVFDAQQHLVSGIRLNKPISIIYHYQSAEMHALDLDPDHIYLVWPTAQQAKRAAAALVLPLQNNARTQTLTTQTTVLNTLPFALSGDPQIQSPPTPHLASIGGNSGQLTYSYPLQVPAGPAGFVPPLTLNYSSSGPNERQSRTSAAGGAGDGWSLALGSINMENDPASQGSASPGNWYFISGVANVSDRLISDTAAGFYQTEHLSHLRIQQVTSSKTGLPCFNVWDTSGTYYEFGCTSDALQYRTDSTGRTNYLWDLNRIIAPNEGPGTAYKLLLVSYLQDSVTTNGYTSIRDSAIKQITYGYGTSTSSIGTLAGTIDFTYKAPTANGSWASAYGTNYNCNGTPPSSTTLRCDDPITVGAVTSPTVVSTLSLQSVTSYVGSDSSSSNKAYGYTFSYEDDPFSNNCYDAYTLVQMSCAGEHLLKSLTPIVYQNGTSHTLKGLIFGYTGNQEDVYYDSTHTSLDGSQQYTGQTWWRYLNSYRDLNTGVGGTATYATAFSNTHGTPTLMSGSTVTDDRYDPLYCSIHANDSTTSNQCIGNYLHPEDRAWSQQVVTQTTTIGKDSSALPITTTSYHYKLAKTGTHSSGSAFCYPAGSESDCVGDNWIPVNSGVVDGDWQDYYHSEFHGFAEVDITSAAGDLTVDKYYSTKGWGTPNSDAGNYNSGHLYEEDVYRGNQATDVALLQVTTNQYPGVGGATTNSCNGQLNTTYAPCEVMILSTRTTRYEGTGSGNTSAPWVQHDYTYDNYRVSSGLGDYHQSPATGSYHNLQQEVISSSNAPTVTKKWTYYTNNQTVGTWVYYTVDKIAHSEVDDSGGHVWQCQDNTYDQGQPAAGWLIMQRNYSSCTNALSILTSFTAYDAYGDTVASVDPYAVSNGGLYTNNGCTLSVAPGYQSSLWGLSRYTTCTMYDSYLAHVTSTTNALNQTSNTSYDYTQGAAPTSKTDANGQTTTTAYSYDNNGNQTVHVSQPNEVNGYTSQSQINSLCTSSSTLPCFEIDSNTSQYLAAITRTFYDAQGRKIETRTPGPDFGHDTIVFTVYDDAHHSTFQSEPFRVLAGSTWLDPNGATDDSGLTPGGTTTYYDALNRVVGTQDPMLGSATEPGISCPGLSGTWTTCTVYGLGLAYRDLTTYATTTTLDPNNHESMSFSDELGRTRYSQQYSGTGISPVGANITVQQQTQYNVLDKPTSVTVTDLAPQAGQSITQVTTTTSYDDLGRVTSQNDPDRGTHTYTYDADGRVSTDTSGSRTLGYSYDLTGRLGCLQDSAPTPSVTGVCSSGSHPYVQNTYDTTQLGTQGSTDFPIGRLTQSIATTTYADGTAATATTNLQYDQRGRTINSTLQIGVPSTWNVTTALPAYQETLNYNDANQPAGTQTSIGGVVGYNFSQVYDSFTGTLTGLSNSQVGVANLATLSFNAQAKISSINFLTSTNTALATEGLYYDGNQRMISKVATWQSGSGTSGTMFGESMNYDSASNVLSTSTVHAVVPGQTSSGGGETQNFCYDEQNRLIWAGNSGTQPVAGSGTCGNSTLSNTLTGATYSNSFVYTNLGQTWQGPLNAGAIQYQYLYCNSSHPHQLSGIYPTGTTCANLSGQVYTSSYDAWGNVSKRFFSGTTANLSYNGLDHFTEWNASANNHEWYVYDASGNRVLKRTTNGSGTSLTTYPFGLEEHGYDSTGAINTGNKYYYTLGGILLGELAGTATSFFLTDTLGSVLTNFSNVAGSAVIRGNVAYGPYGKTLYRQGSPGTAKGFTGQYNDSLTGLDYYNARYYDPIAGQFLSPDTVQDNTAGMDPYSYVGSNPETRNDPTGHCWPFCAIVIGALIGAVVNVAATVVTSAIQGKVPSGGEIVQAAVTGAVAGAVMGLAGPAGPLARVAASAAGNGLSQVVGNAMSGKPLMDGVGMAVVSGALMGGVMEGAGALIGKFGRTVADDATSVLDDTTSVIDGACSFTAMTPVTTDHGKQPIGTLKVGEKVLAYNPKTRKMELQPILHVWIHKDDDLVNLTITTHSAYNKGAKPTREVIHTNKKHPFLTVEKGFLPVGQLKLGMHMLEADGQVGVISGLMLVPGVMTMYNLEVAQDHTFVVGFGQWVVHNCSSTKLGRAIGRVRGEQAHHIIPCECESNSLVRAAQRMGFDIDGASNGIALADNPIAASVRGEPYHMGSHPRYTRYIIDRLNYYGSQLGTAAVPTAIDGVNRTIRDGLTYIAALVPGGRIS